MDITKEFCSPLSETNYRSIFAGNVIERCITKEELELQIITELHSVIPLVDRYMVGNYAVYKGEKSNGEKGNIIILNTYNMEDDVDEPPYHTDELIDFVCNEFDHTSNNIIYVSQLYGTSLDYLIVYDDIFYNKIYSLDDGFEVLGEFRQYCSKAAKKDKSHYKYTAIVNGEYRKLV